MKLASPGLISLLSSTKELIFADLWKFTLKSGVVVSYTSWDADLTVGGVTYASHDVILMGGDIKQARSLEVNQTELTCYPNLTDDPSVVSIPSTGGTVAVYGGLMSLAETLGGALGSDFPLLQACVLGLFDRAQVERSRIFMPTDGDVSLGAVRIFLGEIKSIELTRNYAKFTCTDLTDILNIQMPRRQYQPTCPWTFGDSDCTFNKSSLTVTATVGAGSAGTNIVCAALTQANGYFGYGTVTFTSGQNTGISRSVKSFSTGNVVTSGPFPSQPQVGDTFTITPGCSKNYAGQTQSFNASALTGSTPNNILCGISNVAGFFNGGTLQFTSGANTGLVSTVSSWVPGNAACSPPFINTPALGDEFTITSISTNTTTTCTGYSNTANFGGQPFVPIPETAY